MARDPVAEKVSPRPWSPLELAALAALSFSLGVVAPVFWHGDWPRLLSPEAWRPFASPELTPWAAAAFWRRLLEILPGNLGIALIASVAAPLAVRALKLKTKNLPGLYVVAVSFAAGVAATPARMMGGGWFFLKTLPFALLEVGGYVAAGAAGIGWVWKGRLDARLLALAALLIGLGAVLEAATIVLLYEPAIGGGR